MNDPLAIAKHDAGDLARLHRAVERARAVGGDLGWLGEMLAKRLGPPPAPRAARRDAALAELSVHYAGSDRGRARAIATDLRRYAASRWLHERALDAAPVVHGEKGRALFAVMRVSDRGAPGFETIRNALKIHEGAWVKNPAVPITHKRAHAFGDSSERGRNVKATAEVRPDQSEALAALARQPATLRLVADDRARLIAGRQARVDRIAALDAQAEINWPKSQKRIAAAVEEVRKVERRLREAGDALGAANAADFAAGHEYSRARQVEEAQLIESADGARIEAWKRELRGEIDAAMRRGVLATVERTEKNPITREITRHVTSNSPSIRRRLKALREAHDAAGMLYLEPDQARLPEIIAGLRDRLPKIDSGPTFPAAPDGEAA